MRLLSFSRLRPKRRRAARQRRADHAPLRVRRLERRRVLDAALQGLVVAPTALVDGSDTTETQPEPLVFDWSTGDTQPTQDAAQQDARQPHDAADASAAPADGDSVGDPNADQSQLVAGAQSSIAAEGIVDNVRPVLIPAANQTAVEGHELDMTGDGTPVLGIFADTDAEDTHTAMVHWGDDMPAETAMIVAVPGGGAIIGSHTYADDRTYTVTVSVTDSLGGSDIRTFQVTVSNAAPTGLLGNNGPVDEGSDASVFFSMQSDPSTADTAAGFRYAYDFDNDGIFDVGDGTYEGSVEDASQTVPASFFASGPGTYTVAARIIDKNDGHTAHTTDVEVQNGATELTEITGDTIDEGHDATVGVTISDSNPNAVFSVDVDWMDGSTATITDLGTTNSSGTVGDTTFTWTASTRRLELTHTYLDDGAGPGGGAPTHTYAVQLAVHDDGEQFSGPYTANVTVNNLRPVLVPAANQTVSQGETLDMTGVNSPVLGLFIDPGVLDSHVAIVDWGDGSNIETAMVTFVDGAGALGGSHVYAVQGMYTVTLRLADDDMGAFADPAKFLTGTLNVDFVERTFTVTVIGNQRPVLIVAANQTVDEGALLDMTGMGTPLLAAFFDPDTSDSHSATVNWGDGSPTSSDVSVVFVNGAGALGASHKYADNGVYTVTVTVTDNAGDSDTKSFLVTVLNVDPTLTGTDGLALDEGHVFTLAELGVAISDPGYDNPANPLAQPGGSVETFEVMQIDWGDGHVQTIASPGITNRQSPDGGPTTADLVHFQHAYADGGPEGTDYTVTVTVRDDDGGWVERTFTILVRNVPPELTLTTETIEVNEGTLLVILDLGAFTDPGFTDPVTGTSETFTYTIDWGDGSPPDTLQMPASVTNGNRPTDSLAAMQTSGTLANSHFYANNDPDNVYTITVTLSDDDGGLDVEHFDIRVLNVNPTLNPITATDVDILGRTVLTLSFSDPGAEDYFEIQVDWGDRLHLPPAERFVVETVHMGSTPASFTLVHFYTGPPDPLNPTADITIRVVIHDADAAIAGVVEPGISNVESVVIRSPSLDVQNPGFFAPSDRGGTQFVPPAPAPLLLDQPTLSLLSQQSQDRRVGSGSSIATDTYLELVVVSLDGEELESIQPLQEEMLLDLRALFANLPDGRYRIYLIRTENNSRRLVIEVYVRRGRVIDLSDDSEGTRDRPPTSETLQQPAVEQTEENQPADADEEPQEASELVPPNAEGARVLEDEPAVARSLQWAAPVAALAVAARGGWSQRLLAALQHGDDRDWQRLRRAARIGKHAARPKFATKSIQQQLSNEAACLNG